MSFNQRPEGGHDESGHENTEDAVVRGIVERVTFSNPTNGYSVLQIRTDDTGDRLTVVGICPGIEQGKAILARGRYKQHAKFGKQLEAASISETMPQGTSGLFRYLRSGAIDGIGGKTAEKLIEAFGDKVLEIVSSDPERVALVDGVGRHKARILFEALNAQTEKQEAIRFLVERQIPLNMADKIIQKFGVKAPEIVAKDPYILARSMRGVGFRTADTIAAGFGVERDSAQRIKAGVLYALETISEDGHLFASTEDLVFHTQRLLELETLQEQVFFQSLAELQSETIIMGEDNKWFLSYLYKAETELAASVASRIMASQQIHDTTAQLAHKSLEEVEKELGISFSAEQRDAVAAGLSSKLLIITGGPGCGKTTVTRALVRLFEKAQKTIALAAPTGRAAQRMASVCGCDATTIHRLLKYDPFAKQFFFGLKTPLPNDVVIIDESSMLDVLLARDLFAAVSPRTILILVGDKDQLPSVGPGRVFGDLVGLPEVPTHALTRLFRRGHQSKINDIAYAINAGIVPEIPEAGSGETSDAYFVSRKDPEEILKAVVTLVSKTIPAKFEIRTEDIVVLSPLNRGPVGTEAINLSLQEALNPQTNIKAEVKIFGDAVLREGDRVVQRSNNYNLGDIGVFNGETGRVLEVEPVTRSMMVELWDDRLVRYSAKELPQVSLAYALSVHRSQGSEYACVVLVLHDSQFMLLERQLLYTAVTRAKKLLILVGSRRACMIATQKASGKKRKTLLGERVRKLL